MTTSSMAVRTSALPVAAGGGVYAASKAAAEMLMKYAAIEVSQACFDEAKLDEASSTYEHSH